MSGCLHSSRWIIVEPERLSESSMTTVLWFMVCAPAPASQPLVAHSSQAGRQLGQTQETGASPLSAETLRRDQVETSSENPSCQQIELGSMRMRTRFLVDGYASQ